MQTPSAKAIKIFPQDILDELVRRIVEAVDPERIILFGSAARGDFHEGSDLDVLVVVPEGTHRRHVAEKIYGHLPGFGYGVDVVAATEGDLQRYGQNFSLVYYPALKEGKTLYDRAAA